MKIRAYIVPVIAGVDPVYTHLTTVEPPGVIWASFHRGSTSGLAVIAAQDTFDFTAIDLLSGIAKCPVGPLDKSYADLRQTEKDRFKLDFQRIVGRTLDDSDITDYEDLMCAVLRANGETGRRRLRHVESQRTRQFLDSFNTR